MRDPSRIPRIVNELYQIWAMQPDLRLGQIMGNADISYYTEDDEALEKLVETKERIAKLIKAAQ